jgi:ATP/maltotriose-dependent transcriptional regulator MalT
MPGTPRRAAHGPVVERAAELAALDHVLSDLDGGQGSCVCVIGPAGMGKTTLVRVFADRAASDGCRTWLASAGELDGQVPFGVLRRLLDQPVRDLTAADRQSLEGGPARRALSQLWGGAPAPSEPTDQGDMLHSLAWLLGALVASGPAAVIVDDAQWADEESLIFLASLRERLHHMPLAVIVAARDERGAEGRGLARLVADPDALVMRLAALSRTGVDAVLDERWPGVGAATAAAVHEVTDGNPFLVTALTDALGDRAGTVDADVVRATVPASVVDLILARLSVLSPSAQSLAWSVAVLGTGPTAVAAVLAGISIEQAGEAADDLRRIGLLADAPELAFRHSLLRSAVDATLGADARDRLHRTAARLLADSGERGRSRAAAHLLASAGVGDPWAVGILRAAANDALAVGAPQSAVALLSRAVDEPADTTVRPALLVELGTAQMRMFDPACIDTLGRAVDAIGDPVSRARCSLLLATALAYGGLHAQAAQTLAEARDQITGLDRELELTVEAAWAAAALLVRDEVGAARQRLDRFVDLDGATVGERRVLIQQLCVAAETNRPAATIRRLAERVVGDWATPEQFPETADWAWPRLLLTNIGQFDEVRRLCDAGVAHAQTQGSVVGLVTAAFVRGFTELHAGALVDAERSFRQMLASAPGRGQRRSLLADTLGNGGLAQALALQGRVDEATDVLARLPRELPAHTPVNGAAMVWFGRAVTCHAAGDHVGAVDAAVQAGAVGAGLDIDSPTWASWRPLMVRPLRALGRLDEAREIAAEHLALCRASDVPHLVGEALCLSGSVAADPDDGAALARQGVELLAGTGSRWRLGQGQLTLGVLLRRAGRKAEAREHLRESAGTLSACGAATDAAFAREELLATGARLTRTHHRQLTPSETRVVRLALAGHSNAEIAAQLFVGRKTVETHLSAAYRKLGVTGRDDLTVEHLRRAAATEAD